MRAAPFLFFVLLTAGCGSGSGMADYAADEAKSATAASAPMAGAAAKMAVAAGEKTEATVASMETPAPRLMVRNAELTLRVKDIERGEQAVGEIARRAGGGVEASQGSDLAGPTPNLSITLRVPESHFDRTLVELEGLGTRLGKTIASEDVTSQAVDLDARLKSLRVQEEAYRAILGGARKIPDVLTVQERLTEVRTQIEQLVAQRRDLGDQAARSKIVVSLSQALSPTAPAPEPDWLAQTWGDATGALRATGRWLASVGLWLVAMLPIWLPVTLLGTWAYRRTRLKAV